MSTTAITETDTTTPVSSQPRTLPERKAESKQLPLYGVILHDDPVNGFDFVVGALRRVFGFAMPKAFWLTFRAHTVGRSCVWTGHRELAELKAEQLRSCGPDPAAVHRGAHALGVSIEALPGQ